MGHTPHDWDRPRKKELVRGACGALPPGGSPVVYDTPIDDDRRRSAFGPLMGLNVPAEAPGGSDYAGADCRAWLTGAGFRQTRVEHLVGPDSAAVGVK